MSHYYLSTSSLLPQEYPPLFVAPKPNENIAHSSPIIDLKSTPGKALYFHAVTTYRYESPTRSTTQPINSVVPKHNENIAHSSPIINLKSATVKVLRFCNIYQTSANKQRSSRALFQKFFNSINSGSDNENMLSPPQQSASKPRQERASNKHKIF